VTPENVKVADVVVEHGTVYVTPSVEPEPDTAAWNVFTSAGGPKI